MPPISPNRIRVLLVDDDRKLCRLTSHYLAAHGYELTTVHDGHSALTQLAFRANVFEAVILDAMLPGIDGFEVLRRIRSLNSIPVLMFTACSVDSDRRTALSIGANDYIAKTIVSRELVTRLQEILANYRETN